MTRNELRTLFDSLNLGGNHLVVHGSLSSFGHVDGGARAVCEALVEAVGDGATIIMPAFTCAETLSDMSTAPMGSRRPVAFHPDLPVSRPVGAIAEAFRHFPGTLRSSHPTHSFAAWGRQA